jgi:serine/threonine-protein kinase RsbW
MALRESACPVPPTAGGLWSQVSLRRGDAVGPLLDQVEVAMTERGYPPRDVMGLCLALQKAIVNGLRHGNGNDPSKQVVVRYPVGPEEVLSAVEDEGPGFDPQRVPDPTAPENLDRSSGRGLLLLRHFTTRSDYHGRGNRVTLCKSRTAPPGPQLWELADSLDVQIRDGHAKNN